MSANISIMALNVILGKQDFLFKTFLFNGHSFLCGYIKTSFEATVLSLLSHGVFLLPSPWGKLYDELY